MAIDYSQVKNWIYGSIEESPFPKCVKLINQYLDKGQLVVDLGAGVGTIGLLLKENGFEYYGLESHPAALDILLQNGLSGTGCDLNDLDNLNSVIEDLGDISTFCLLDVIEHLVEPQRLLQYLSDYLSKKSKAGYLVVSVPNVTHHDLGIKLLLGRWDVRINGLLDATHLRFFTNDSLLALLGNCGWQFLQRDDFTTQNSDQFDLELVTNLPLEIQKLLLEISNTSNPYNEVKQFIWILKSKPINNAPLTFFEAVNNQGHLNAASLSFEDTKKALAGLSELKCTSTVECEEKCLELENLHSQAIQKYDRLLEKYRELDDYHSKVNQDRNELLKYTKHVEDQYKAILISLNQTNSNLEQARSNRLAGIFQKFSILFSDLTRKRSK